MMTVERGSLDRKILVKLRTCTPWRVQTNNRGATQTAAKKLWMHHSVGTQLAYIENSATACVKNQNITQQGLNGK